MESLYPYFEKIIIKKTYWLFDHSCEY